MDIQKCSLEVDDRDLMKNIIIFQYRRPIYEYKNKISDRNNMFHFTFRTFSRFYVNYVTLILPRINNGRVDLMIV